MVLGEGAFRRWLGHEWDECLITKPSEPLVSSTLWGHSKKTAISGKDLISWGPDFGLVNLQKHEKLLFTRYPVYVFLLQQLRLAVVFSSPESSVAKDS